MCARTGVQAGGSIDCFGQPFLKLAGNRKPVFRLEPGRLSWYRQKVRKIVSAEASLSYKPRGRMALAGLLPGLCYWPYVAKVVPVLKHKRALKDH